MDNPIMQGFPPPPAARPPMADWDRAPWNRWSFSHVRELLPTVDVWRGDGPARALLEAPQDLGALRFEGAAGATTIDAFLENSFTDGFLILHRGKRIFERYSGYFQPQHLHLSQSVAKSLIGALTGILCVEGVVAPDDPITRFLPELSETAYRDARLRHVLDMTSGTAFNEEYTDPFSDMARIDVACGWKPPPQPGDWQDCVFDVIKTLRTLERPHGAAFSYRSVETDVLAMCLERASGVRLADLLAGKLWSRIGAEQSACFTVDRAGYALADGGFNATLRDYARFGQMILDNGTAGGQQIVPEAWIADTCQADHSRFGAPTPSCCRAGAIATSSG